MKFINRYDEHDFLNEEYQSDRAYIIVIYRRRRIGKTALITAFGSGNRHIL
jgi:AAA+ ATPase superfamily predicted ATPase